MKNLITNKRISACELCERMRKYKKHIDKDTLKILDGINLKLKKTGKGAMWNVTYEALENFFELLCRTLQGDPTAEDTIKTVVKDLIGRKMPISFAETFIFGFKDVIFPYLQKEFSDSYYGFFSAQKNVDAALRRIWTAAIDEYYRQTMSSIEKNEKKFRALFESSRDALMTLEPPSWMFTAGNPATVNMFLAKDEAEFISKGPWEVSPKYQPDGTLSGVKAKKMIMKAMKKGSNFFEWTHKRLDGEDFPATVLLTRMEIDGRKLLQATVRDITKEKKAEEALKESEKKYRTIFDNAGDGILIADMKTKKFTMANRKMCNMLGYTENEIKKLNVLKIHPKKDLPTVLKAFKLQAQRKITVAKCLPMLRKNKTVFYADISSTPLAINGKAYLVGFFRKTGK